MIRQGLERDAVAALAMLRSDGRPVLQSRDAADASVVEILAREVRPRFVRLEKRGLYVSISVAGGGDDPRPAGGSVLLPIIGDFYFGLAARARDVRAPALLRFARVTLGSPSPGQAARPRLVSTLETMNVATRQR